jgi:hypothetical protein
MNSIPSIFRVETKVSVRCFFSTPIPSEIRSNSWVYVSASDPVNKWQNNYSVMLLSAHGNTNSTIGASYVCSAHPLSVCPSFSLHDCNVLFKGIFWIVFHSLSSFNIWSVLWHSHKAVSELTVDAKKRSAARTEALLAQKEL